MSVHRRDVMTPDQAFALIEAAVIAGARCPMTQPHGPLSQKAIPTLVKQGKIVSRVSGRNWRTVTILVGPHAGKRTMPDPNAKPGAKPRLITGRSHKDSVAKLKDYSQGS